MHSGLSGCILHEFGRSLGVKPFSLNIDDSHQSFASFLLGDSSTGESEWYSIKRRFEVRIDREGRSCCWGNRGVHSVYLCALVHTPEHLGILTSKNTYIL